MKIWIMDSSLWERSNNIIGDGRHISDGDDSFVDNERTLCARQFKFQKEARRLSAGVGTTSQQVNNVPLLPRPGFPEAAPSVGYFRPWYR
jgi:hypothetical protein